MKQQHFLRVEEDIEDPVRSDPQFPQFACDLPEGHPSGRKSAFGNLKQCCRHDGLVGT
jgi:hypothetical protein